MISQKSIAQEAISHPVVQSTVIKPISNAVSMTLIRRNLMTPLRNRCNRNRKLKMVKEALVFFGNVVEEIMDPHSAFERFEGEWQERMNLHRCSHFLLVYVEDVEMKPMQPSPEINEHDVDNITFGDEDLVEAKDWVTAAEDINVQAGHPTKSSSSGITDSNVSNIMSDDGGLEGKDWVFLDANSKEVNIDMQHLKLSPSQKLTECKVKFKVAYAYDKDEEDRNKASGVWFGVSEFMERSSGLWTDV